MMLKTLLAKRPVIGLLIDRQRITLSVVARTPMGPKQIGREVCQFEGASPEDALKTLLDPWVGKLGGKIGPWVHVALPESSVFQSIVPITENNRSASPQALFLEAVQASNARADDRMIDLNKLDVNKQSLACILACPRASVESTVSMMGRLGTRVSCIESAPAALFRAGCSYQKAPRGSKLCVRFFLGRPLSIGILGFGSQPLCWHPFELTEGDESQAILAAYSTLWMISRRSRITLPIDSMILHGLPELELTVDADGFKTRTGAQFSRSPEPIFDAAAIAYGAALADPLDDQPKHDLARSIKPSVLIRDIFPWGELAMYAVLLMAMSIFLAGMAAEADAKLKSIEIERGTFAWLKKQDQAKLETERKSLDERLSAADLFRNTRMNWSHAVRTVAASAPDNTIVTALTGEGEVDVPSKSGKSSAKKQMIVALETPLSNEDDVPQEQDSIVAALRQEPSLKKHFPLINVTGLKIEPAKKDTAPTATYSIICLPKKDSAPAAPTKKGKAAKG